jgi:hypothetical protein
MAKLERLKKLPWSTLLQGGALARSRWRELSAKDRRRIAELLRRSRGLPGNLTAKERGELRKLFGKIDLKAAGRDLLAVKSKPRKRR